MKNFILVLFTLFIFSATAVASPEASDSIASAQTADQIIKIYDKLEGGLISLAKALKTPTEHVYEVLVRQQVVYASQSLIVLIVLLAMVASGLIGVLNKKNYIFYSDGSMNDLKITGWVYWVLFVIGTVAVFIWLGKGGINDVVSGFFNPEYGAINKIFSIIQ